MEKGQIFPVCGLKNADQRRSLGHPLYARYCFKNTKFAEQMLEIAFRDFLRRSGPARSKVGVNISHPLSPHGHPTPPELRARSIRRLTAPKSTISRVPKWVSWWCVMVMAYTKFQNVEGFYRISRSSSVRYGSYSTVSKYSPVLSNCKVWTKSAHWWWR